MNLDECNTVGATQISQSRSLLSVCDGRPGTRKQPAEPDGASDVARLRHRDPQSDSGLEPTIKPR